MKIPFPLVVSESPNRVYPLKCVPTFQNLNAGVKNKTLRMYVLMCICKYTRIYSGNAKLRREISI